MGGVGSGRMEKTCGSFVDATFLSWSFVGNMLRCPVAMETNRASFFVWEFQGGTLPQKKEKRAPLGK